MRLNNMFLENQIAHLQKAVNELLDFVNVAQVTTSHLIQDGDVIGDGVSSTQNLKTLSEELLEKFNKYEV
jgi:hypothetical protein